MPTSSERDRRRRPRRGSTAESSSSPTTSTSPGRCSKRRRFSRPLTTTPPASIEVTRVIGTKMRRRGCTSSTRPMMRGGRGAARSVATTSRILPSWSPLGSKTEAPVRRAMKTRVGALTGRGYRRSALLTSDAPDPRSRSCLICASLPYVVLDVFTERPFAGNPLAVVMDAEGLSGEQMLQHHPRVQPLGDGLSPAADRGRTRCRR